jgi:putative protease
VAVATRSYRKAIDAFYEDNLTDELKAELTADLKSVFNREFSDGFYMGQPINDWSKEGNFATKKKEQIGKILKVYPKINVIELAVQANNLKIGDEVLVTGERCGAYFFELESMQVEHESIEFASKGINVGIKVKDASDLRANDKVYRLVSIFGAV